MPGPGPENVQHHQRVSAWVRPQHDDMRMTTKLYVCCAVTFTAGAQSVGDAAHHGMQHVWELGSSWDELAAQRVVSMHAHDFALTDTGLPSGQAASWACN